MNELDETPTVGASASDSRHPSSFQKLKLATPQLHGESLQVPALSQIDSLWHRNRRNHTQQHETGRAWLTDLRNEARNEVLQLAACYSQQYGGFAGSSDNNQIVMAGHQPSLFHPGVWYKNFVLSELGQRFKCTSVNLIVDNDICMSASIRTPQGPATRPSFQLVPFDTPFHGIPFEERAIEDLDLFRSFEARAAQSIETYVERPIVKQFWPRVREVHEALSTNGDTRLGSTIAAGRHLWESEIGLQTVEIPLSLIANSKSFAAFALKIFGDRVRFRAIYNTGLNEYRRLYKIRSGSHPVPELSTHEQWVETPFWIWRTDDPFRKRLFVKENGSAIALSNLEDWQIEFPMRNGIEAICGIAAQGIKIRPRALTTTMFCRLFLSDLFIHGIGGAKYDQLTERIAQDFFGTELAECCVISATMQLPTDAWPVTPPSLVAAKQELRNLRFHAERFIDTASYPEAITLIDAKLELIHQGPVPGQAKRHRDAIENLNEQLRVLVEPQKVATENNLEQIESQLDANRVLGSREYSFCLFPEQLVDTLGRLCEVPTQSGSH